MRHASNNKLAVRWSRDENGQFSPKQADFLEGLSRSRSFRFENETNLKVLSRTISRDENLWKTFFAFTEKLFKDTITKARTSRVPWHLQVEKDGRRIQFRYSRAFDPVKRSFLFARFYDHFSKINHDKDVGYYIFLGRDYRLIVDYQQLRYVAPAPDWTDNFDAAFSFNTLVDAGCVVDILKITSNDDTGETFMETFDSKTPIHVYQQNIMKWDILASGNRGKPLVLVVFKDGVATVAVREETIQFHGETKVVERPFESVTEVYSMTIMRLYKGLKIPAYRTLAQENITFVKAFKAWKETGKLPRTLPLLKVTDSKLIALVDYEISKDERFGEFTQAIVERIKNKKPRNDLTKKVEIKAKVA